MATLKAKQRRRALVTCECREWTWAPTETPVRDSDGWHHPRHLRSRWTNTCADCGARLELLERWNTTFQSRQLRCGACHRWLTITLLPTVTRTHQRAADHITTTTAAPATVAAEPSSNHQDHP